MDAARVARRLGAEESVVVYRRSMAQMPAHADELEGAQAEGVQMNWLRTITSMNDEDLTVEIMELDEDGKARGTGVFEKLEADTVILALGQRADTHFLRAIPGMSFNDDVVEVDPHSLMTGGAGHLRRRRRRAVGPHRHHRRRPRQEGGPADRRLAEQGGVGAGGEAPGGHPPDDEPVVLR